MDEIKVNGGSDSTINIRQGFRVKYLKIIVIITVLSLPLIFSLAPQEILKLKTFDTFVKTMNNIK